MHVRGYRLATATAVVALVLAACSSSTATPAPTAGSGGSVAPSTGGGGSGEPTGKVTVAVTGLPSLGLDHMQVLELPSKALWDEIYDYPIEQDAEGKLIPGLATSWSASDDQLTWTFEIRDGVKFHNGDPLTAEDVAWSWSRLIFDPATKHTMAGYADIVESITADGNKVLVKTNEPQANVPLWFAQMDGGMAGSVQSKKYFESVGAEAAAANPVGTGPYKWVKANGEQSVDLTAFLDPERGDWQKSRTPGFKDVTILAVPDGSTRLALLKTGEADFGQLSLASAQDASAAGINLITAPSSNFTGMNCLGFTKNAASPCNDKRVREALSIGFDREAIAKSVYQGKATTTSAFLAGPGTVGYPEDLPAQPYDPDRAKQLLTEAGFNESNPLNVQIITYEDDADFPMMPTMAEAIVGYYQQLGIQAVVTPMEYQTMKAGLIDGTLPGLDNSNTVTPVTLQLKGIDNRFNMISDHISVYTAAGPQGAGVWNNEKLPEQQSRLDAIANEFDLDKQAEMFADYNKWMAQEFVNIPLLASGSVFGATNRIASWDPIAGRSFVHNLWTLKPAG